MDQAVTECVSSTCWVVAGPVFLAGCHSTDRMGFGGAGTQACHSGWGGSGPVG